MSLPPEVEASYAAIIDSILASSDLNTISAKRIRKGLQEQVGHDISDQKEAITQLIHTRFDKFTQSQTITTTPAPADPAPTVAAPATAMNGTAKATNGTKSEPPSCPKKRAAGSPTPDDEDESELSEVADMSPPKKKPKKSASASASRSVEEEDAAFAARLQAEENSRARSTRGGGNTKKRAPVKKEKGVVKRKKKSAMKVRSDDDSEVESGSGAEKKERKGGFHKPFTLSTPLSSLLGETQLSRPQTVKKIWEYIKAHDLQDPTDKRQIRCDEPLRAIFKQDRVHMFTMNKILNQNLYPVDE